MRQNDCSETATAILTQAANSLVSRIRAREANDANAFAERIGFSPDPWQLDFLRSSEKRIILNCCRQSGKSTVTSILATHTAFYVPSSLTLVASPSERQSAELLRKIRENFESLPDAPKFETDSVLKFETEQNSRVIALPLAIKNLRGFSKPDLIIVDEAAFIEDSLFHALSPMLAINPQARLILLSTGNGKRGFFYEIWRNGDENEWLKIKITACECPRISEEFLESERRTMPDFLFRQEYFCEFTDAQTQIFSSADIQRALNDGLETIIW
jgi:hypothetical protein